MSSETSSDKADLHTAAGRQFGAWVLRIWRPYGFRARVGLLAAAIACVAVFGFVLNRMQTPRILGFDGSLLNQNSAGESVIVLLVTAVLLVVCVMLGTAIAGAIRFEAGLFAGCIGLAIFSLRSGTMQSVLFEAGGSAHIYWKLMVELLCLAAVELAIWNLLIMVSQPATSAGHSSTESAAKPGSGASPGWPMGLAATGVQMISTAVFLSIFCQAATKNQAMAAVLIGSLLGTMLAYLLAPVRQSVWYWIGPLLVGLIGYGLAATGFDRNLAIGTPTGTWAAIAMPLPVDYASMGTAGAILGFWFLSKSAEE